jgi:non-ribosomal peptide synthetase component F
MIVGWLGILKAGGAYVPLDPADPPSRLAFVAADTGLHIVVTQSGLAGAVPFEGVEVVCVDTVAAEEGDAPEENPAGESALDDLVYVMYTSGSTGRPKGVEITHRGIVRLLFGVDYATFNAEQVWLQLAPPAFDASTLEVWGALLHGGRCVSFPDRVPTPARLSAMIRRHRVNALWLTTSLFNAVVDEAPQTLVPIEQLLVGGEALSVAHVRRALAALPTTRLINGYEPTESTTFTCCYPIPREISDRVTSIPIGRGRLGTRECMCWTNDWTRCRSGHPGSCTSGATAWRAGTGTDPS